MKLKKIYGLFILILFYFSGFSQNEQNQWFFGSGAGLDFTSNPPTILTAGSMTTGHGSASIADASGNLLFYTNAASIWNQTHGTMNNGTGLLGANGGAAQNSLILKQPGSTHLYYLFTIDGNLNANGFNYSIIDMSLAAGLGSVTVKNASLFPSPCEGKLTATRHCNGIDYWVLIRENNYNSGNSAFRAYQLTSAGISTLSVNSTFTFSNVLYGAFGCMKLSPNGKKLACANYQAGTNQSAPAFELFDFDNSNGTVSNHLSLSAFTGGGPGGSGYGVEYSPDGSKLFGSVDLNIPQPNYAQVLQWDLCAGTGSAIAASHTIVGIATATANESFGSLQLAPNGKIYMSVPGKNSLYMINNPNMYGAASNFSTYAQSVSPKYTIWGLPNFCNSQFIPHPTPPPFSHTVSNAFGCQTAQFTAPSVNSMTTVACSSIGYSVTGYLWNFGDPLSGATNTSGIANPSHAYTALGTYTAQLILYYSCGGGTDTLWQTINVNQSCVSVTSSSITCANLGSATVSPVAGLGPYTYTWLPGLQTSSTITGLIPGTYTIVFHDAISNVTSTSSVTLLPLVPLSGNVNNSNSITCYGALSGTASVSGLTGGSGNQSYFWFNGITSYTTNPITTLSAGLWSVTVTDALTACQIKQSFFISQAPASTLNISSNSPTACVGTNIILTGTNSGGIPGYTYTWTLGPSSNSQTITELSSGTYVYTLSSADVNNCLSTKTIAVDFIPYPVLSTSNVFTCPLAIGTLTVSGASNYTWSSPSTTALSTGNSFTDAPLSTQQYTIVGESLGCSSQAMASIALYNLPNPISNNNSPRCNGDLLSLTGFGGVSYVWSGPNSFTSTSQSNSINPVSLANAGVYNLTVTAATGCTASISKTVVVNPTPTLSASGSTVCTSQTLNLSASSFTGSTYLWSGPPNFTSTLQNPFISNPLVNNTGTYTVKVTSALGCTNIATTVASVALPPSLTAQLSSNTLCSQAFNGSPNTITLTAGGANTYTLVTVPDMFNANPGGPVSPLTAIPPNTGIASATLSGSNGVCTVTTGLTFSILPNPSISVSSPTPVICAGDTYTYTNNGASSYTWSSSTPGFTTYNNGGVAVSNPSINSVFSVFGGSLGCNSASKTSSITVNPLPVFSISPGTPTICLNNKITLSINGNASSYTWSPYVGLNSNVGSTVSAFPTSLQTYTALGSLNSCTNTALITVSVLSLPSPTAIALKPELCLNELITLQGYGGESYRWDGPVNLMYAGQTVTFVARSRAFSGTYTLTVTDVNGCMASNQVAVKINPLPNADLSISKQSGCVPFTSKFSMYTQSANDSNIVAYWQLDNQTFCGKQFSYLFTTAKTFSIFGYYSDTLTSCKNSATYVVEGYPLPKANFMIEPEKPVEGLDEVYFMNTSSGDELKKFNWYFINNKGYQSENKNTSYLFNELGEYPVAMLVKNKWGCADTIVKSIKVESDYNLYVPNAFTPNEDNLNDVFLPSVRGVKLYELFIFNRWGKLIFSTNQIQTGWDGYYNGEPAKNDIYTWKISLSTNSGEMKSLNGHVTLSR